MLSWHAGSVGEQGELAGQVCGEKRVWWGDLGHGYSRDLKLTCSSRRSAAGSLLPLHQGEGGGGMHACLARRLAGLKNKNAEKSGIQVVMFCCCC